MRKRPRGVIVQGGTVRPTSTFCPRHRVEPKRTHNRSNIEMAAKCFPTHLAAFAGRSGGPNPHRQWKAQDVSLQGLQLKATDADNGPFQERFLLEEFIFAHSEYLPRSSIQGHLLNKTDWCALRGCPLVDRGNFGKSTNEHVCAFQSREQARASSTPKRRGDCVWKDGAEREPAVREPGWPGQGDEDEH